MVSCRICVADLAQCPEQSFRVDWMNRREVGFVERQQRRLVIYVQQVPVGSHSSGICSNEVSAESNRR